MPPMLLVLCYIALSPGALIADDPTGALSGFVTYPDRGPCAGAIVVVASSSLVMDRFVTTDADGVFRLGYLPPGSYTVRVHFAGFRTVETEAQVVAGKTTRVFLLLGPPGPAQMCPLGLGPCIPLIDDQNTQREMPLKADVLSALPLADTAEALTLSAEGLHPHGSATGALYLTDGLNTSPLLRTSPVLPDLYMVETVEVSTAGHDASVRENTDGVHGVTTRGGGNHFIGRLFGHTNPDASVGTEHADAYGGGISGPVLKDRLLYTVAFNKEHRPSATPDTTADGGGIAARRRQNLFAKLTYNPLDALSLDAWVHDVAEDGVSPHETAWAGTDARANFDATRYGLLGWYFLSRDITLNAGFTRQTERLKPADHGNQLRGPDAEGTRDGMQLGFDLVTDTHHVQVGFLAETARSVVLTEAATRRIEDTYQSVFAQDAWHVTPNLVAKYGVRHTRQKRTYTETTRDTGTATAPYLGLTWDFAGDGRTKVYGQYTHGARIRPSTRHLFDVAQADGTSWPGADTDVMRHEGIMGLAYEVKTDWLVDLSYVARRFETMADQNGRASGVAASLHKVYRDAYRFQVRYAYHDARGDVHDSPRQHRRSFSCDGSYAWQSGWQIGAVYRYDKVGGSSAPAWPTAEDDLPFSGSRADMRLGYEPNFRTWQTLHLYADLLNLFGHAPAGAQVNADTAHTGGDLACRFGARFSF